MKPHHPFLIGCLALLSTASTCVNPDPPIPDTPQGAFRCSRETRYTETDELLGTGIDFYYNEDGQLAATVNGTHYEPYFYDSNGRLILEQNVVCDTSYDYLSDGVRHVSQREGTATNVHGLGCSPRTWYERLDDRGRIVEKWDEDGSGHWTITYDDRGRRLEAHLEGDGTAFFWSYELDDATDEWVVSRWRSDADGKPQPIFLRTRYRYYSPLDPETGIYTEIVSAEDRPPFGDTPLSPLSTVETREYLSDRVIIDFPRRFEYDIDYYADDCGEPPHEVVDAYNAEHFPHGLPREDTTATPPGVF